jgi:stage V sporulation protein B
VDKETELSAISVEDRELAHASVPWVYLSSVTLILSGAVFYVYLARVLPTDELGSVVVLAAIAAIMSVVFSLGIGSGFQHFLSYYLGRSSPATVHALIRGSFLLALVLGGGSALLTAALSPGLSQIFFHTGVYASTIELLALFTGLTTALTVLQSVLIGLQRFVAYAVCAIVGYVTMYGSAVVLLYLRREVDSIVIGWVAGFALACVLTVFMILRYARGPTGSPPTAPAPWRSTTGLFRSLLLYSLPIFVSGVFTTGTQYIDRLVLASVADLSSVGVYNYALLIASGSLFLIAPFSTFLVPKISESFGRGDMEGIRSLSSTSTTLIVLVYVPAGLGVAAIAPPLLRVLAGPGFVVASVPLAILVGVSAAFVPFVVLGAVIAGTRRTIVWAEAAGLALFANIVVSLALIPRFGMVGAALGNSSMIWVPFVVFYWALKGTGLIRFDREAIARIWLAAVLMALVVWGPLELVRYDLVLVPLFVLIGVGVLLVSLRALRAVPREVADLFLSGLPKWLGGVRPVVDWVAA